MRESGRGGGSVRIDAGDERRKWIHLQQRLLRALQSRLRRQAGTNKFGLEMSILLSIADI